MTDLAAMLLRLERLESGGGSILDLMEAAGLDPRQGFRGGNWTFVNFDGLLLDSSNFREARLFGATFANSSVAGADFRGAADATPLRGQATGLFAARNWSDAKLDKHQLLALRTREYLQAKSPSQQQFPIADFIRQGLINSSNYHDFMRRSGDYEIARQIYENMKKQGLKPSKYAITALIDLSVNFDDRVDALYAEALRDEVEIDDFLLNAMADAYKDIGKAEAVRELYIKHSLIMTEYYYNIMVNAAPTRADAEKYLGWMAAAQIAPSNITFNSLMNKCPSWLDRKQLIDAMVAEDITIRPHELNILLQAAVSKQEMRDTLDMFRLLKVEREMATENIRIYKRKSFGDALAVAAEAISAGLVPDIHTQKALIQRASSIAEICRAMAVLRPFSNTIDIFNENTIKRMIRVSPDPSWSITRVQGMQMARESAAAQAKALIVHWTDEGSRVGVLKAVFGQPDKD